jgi:hypothetical protein
LLSLAAAKLFICLISFLLDKAAHSSLGSVLDVYTQATTPAQQEAQRAVLWLVFSADASAAVEF